MKPLLIKHWPRWLTIAAVVFLEVSCGDTTINNLPPNDSANSNNGARNSVADWSQAQQTVPCSSISNLDCSGNLGLTINNNGQFAVANNGSIIVQGNITQSELAELNQRIQAARFREVEKKPIQCIPAPNQDQDQGQEQIDILMPQSQKLRVYDHKPRQRQICYRGPIAQTQAINIYLKIIIQEYITLQPQPIPPPTPSPTATPEPTPTPTPTPSPAPTPSPSPSAVVTTIPTGDWGGDHAAMAVNADNLVFQFDCAHGEATDPIVVSSNGHFETMGTIVPEGGPEPAGGRPSLPCRYSGILQGNVITLTIRFLQGSTPRSETFSLTKGQDANITSCL